MRSTMKFILRTSRGTSRLGTLEGFRSNPDVEVQTPNFLLSTRGGTIPNLSRDLLNRLGDVTPLAQIPVGTYAEYKDVLQEYKRGIAQFTGLKGFLIYLNVQDNSQSVPSGHNDNSGVAVWGRGGKRKLNGDTYMDMVQLCQPDFFQSLCDSDTDMKSSNKRIGKSVNRTLQYLDTAVNRLQQSEELKGIDIFGVVEGGYNIQQRLRSAKETTARPVAGFCLEGFHNFDPGSDLYQTDNVLSILREVVPVLPADKPRLLPGFMLPIEIIRAVLLGVDLFDSAYPIVAADFGCALCFPLDGSVVIDSAESSNQADKSSDLEMCVGDPRYSNDQTPLVDGCACYACQKFTRSYIHHLLTSSELLGGILLMMHNLYYYNQFFRSIQKAIECDTLSQLEQTLGSYSSIITKMLTDQHNMPKGLRIYCYRKRSASDSPSSIRANMLESVAAVASNVNKRYGSHTDTHTQNSSGSQTDTHKQNSDEKKTLVSGSST